MSLICKEDLLKDIEESIVFSGRKPHVNAEIHGANKVIDRIRRAPVVSEVEPVKHGEWKSYGFASLKCSVCGFVDDYKMHYKGCPECRALMRR